MAKRALRDKTEPALQVVDIPSTFEEKRKEDALALAQLVYDIYQEKRSNDKIRDGQNYAKQTKSN